MAALLWRLDSDRYRSPHSLERNCSSAELLRSAVASSNGFRRQARLLLHTRRDDGARAGGGGDVGEVFGAADQVEGAERLEDFVVGRGEEVDRIALLDGGSVGGDPVYLLAPSCLLYTSDAA